MSRFTRTIQYGAIGGAILGAPMFFVSTGMHLAGPDDAAQLRRDASDKIRVGVPSWSLVGMLTGAGFAIGFALGAIYGACSYDAPYCPAVLAAPLLPGLDDNIADAIVNIQPENAPEVQMTVQPAIETEALNSSSNGRVSPLGKLNFLARPVTPPVQDVVAQSDISQVNEITPAYR